MLADGNGNTCRFNREGYSSKQIVIAKATEAFETELFLHINLLSVFGSFHDETESC